MFTKRKNKKQMVEAREAFQNLMDALDEAAAKEADETEWRLGHLKYWESVYGPECLLKYEGKAKVSEVCPSKIAAEFLDEELRKVQAHVDRYAQRQYEYALDRAMKRWKDRVEGDNMAQSYKIMNGIPLDDGEGDGQPMSPNQHG